MKKLVILALGGDARTVYMCSELAKDHTVYAYGTVSEPAGAVSLKDLSDLTEKADVLILPMSSGLTETAYEKTVSFGRGAVSAEILFGCLKDNALILGGRSEKALIDLIESNGLMYTDYLKIRSLVIKNAIPTAEGALQIVMEQSPETVFGSRVLITGFGTVAKATAKLFAAAGARVCCAVRRREAAADAEAYGYESADISKLAEIISRYDVIINTVPALILERPVLENADRKAVIVDLASATGGTDFKAADELGIKAVHALALPGKVAPAAAGRYLAEAAEEIISERGVRNVT